MDKNILSKKYFDLISGKADQLYPGWRELPLSSPLRALSEAVAEACAEIEDEIHGLPELISQQLPSLFGVHPHCATPARGIIEVIPKLDSSRDLESGSSIFFDQGLTIKSADGLEYQSTETLSLFHPGQIHLIIEPGRALIGLEKMDRNANINLFLDLDVALFQQKIAWSVLRDSRFIPISAIDHTQGLSRSGFVKLFTSQVFSGTESICGINAYWIEVKADNTKMDLPIRSVCPNALPIENVRRFPSLCLGSGSARPDQSLNLPAGQIAHQFHLRVYNGLIDQFEMWDAKPSFYLSNPDSLHFVIDHEKNHVKFGNGIRGKVCPAGYDNIFIDNLELTDGARGNIQLDTPVTLAKQNPNIQSLHFVCAPSGGTNYGDQNTLYPRLAHLLKNKERAITLDDFQTLALEANPRVGRIFSSSNPSGRVDIQVLLKPEHCEQAEQLDFTPLPSDLTSVQQYLEERSTLNVNIQVSALKLHPIIISGRILVKEANGAYIAQIHQYIRNFLSVYSTEGMEMRPGARIQRDKLFKYLEEQPGIFSVRDLEFVDGHTGLCIKSLQLEDNEIVSIELDLRGEEASS